MSAQTAKQHNYSKLCINDFEFRIKDNFLYIHAAGIPAAELEIKNGGVTVNLLLDVLDNRQDLGILASKLRSSISRNSELTPELLELLMELEKV